MNGLATDGPAARLACQIRIFDAGSRELQSIHFHNEIPAGRSIPVCDLPAGKDLFVFVEGGADNAYAVPAQGNVHDWAHSGWFQTPISQYADLRYVTALPEPSLAISEEGNEVTVVNEGDTVAWQIVLKLLDDEGQLVPEACWSDNFFSLPPHGRKTVTHDGNGTVAISAGL